VSTSRYERQKANKEEYRVQRIEYRNKDVQDLRYADPESTQNPIDKEGRGDMNYEVVRRQAI